jgi:hypothetical protein
MEAPQLVSVNAVTFRTGQANSFDVSATGFPRTPIPGTPNIMQITSQGTLPPGVTLNGNNPFGFATGNAILSGNPPVSARGTYPLTVTAGNGVGSNATQSFTLVVAMPGDVNLDGVVNCADLDLVGAAFGYYRGQPKYNPNADLNNDGVVNFADAALVEASLPPGNSCALSIAFSSMSAIVTTKGNSGNFDVTAAFALNPLSPGINPVTQPFSLQVGDFNVTLGVGSFTALQNGGWSYSGTVSPKGTVLTVQILPSGNKSFNLTASATGGALPKLANPVTVRIGVGEDAGSVSATAMKQ